VQVKRQQEGGDAHVVRTQSRLFVCAER